MLDKDKLYSVEIEQAKLHERINNIDKRLSEIQSELSILTAQRHNIKGALLIGTAVAFLMGWFIENLYREQQNHDLTQDTNNAEIVKQLAIIENRVLKLEMKGHEQ